MVSWFFSPISKSIDDKFGGDQITSSPHFEWTVGLDMSREITSNYSGLTATSHCQPLQIDELLSLTHNPHKRSG